MARERVGLCAEWPACGRAENPMPSVIESILRPQARTFDQGSRARRPTVNPSEKARVGSRARKPTRGVSPALRVISIIVILIAVIRRNLSVLGSLYPNASQEVGLTGMTDSMGLTA